MICRQQGSGVLQSAAEDDAGEHVGPDVKLGGEDAEEAMAEAGMGDPIDAVGEGEAEAAAEAEGEVTASASTRGRGRGRSRGR